MRSFGVLLVIGHYHKQAVRQHDDAIKCKQFLRYWPFVRGIHRSPVNSPHKSQWLGALMFSLLCASLNGWVNTREAGDLRRCRAHYDVIVMNVGFKLIHIIKRTTEISHGLVCTEETFICPCWLNRKAWIYFRLQWTTIAENIISNLIEVWLEFWRDLSLQWRHDKSEGVSDHMDAYSALWLLMPWARFQKRSARDRLRYDPVILIDRSHSTNADHDRLIRSRNYETKQFIANWIMT